MVFNLNYGFLSINMQMCVVLHYQIIHFLSRKEIERTESVHNLKMNLKKNTSFKNSNLKLLGHDNLSLSYPYMMVNFQNRFLKVW